MKHRLRAFSLIELLVSIGVIAILSIVIVQSFMTTVRNNTKTELLKEIKQNGDYVLGTIVRMVQNASAITACSANSFAFTDFNLDTTRLYSYADADGICRIASESSTLSGTKTYVLTSNNVTMAYASSCDDAMNFTCTDINGEPSSVTVSFELKQKGFPQNPADTASMLFRDSAVVRNRQ